MPIKIIRNDITKMPVDAIVNAANESLLGGGGVDGCIHRAAGKRLLEECRTLHGCPTGSAKITKGYDLPSKYVIHAVGPRWRGGGHGERELLISCYRTSLELALQHQCETVAFPLISSGIYGYPKDQALRIAMDTISEFLFEHEMLVYLVIFDKASYQIGEKLFQDIAAYIDDQYEKDHTDYKRENLRMQMPMEMSMPAPMSAPMPQSTFQEEPVAKKSLWTKGKKPKKKVLKEQSRMGKPAPREMGPEIENRAPKEMDPGLEELLCQIDESFSQMLLRKIDEKGMTDAQCYKKANIDRKLFSKIRSDIHYKPSKPTALAFAIALELPLEETKDLLMKAGFALSHSNRFDVIIEYFIAKGNYNIFEINEALFAFDQSLLGA